MCQKMPMEETDESETRRLRNVNLQAARTATVFKTNAMNIPDHILESFEDLVSELIENSSAPFYGLCFHEKHQKDIYISAPYFLVEAYQNYLSKKMENDKPDFVPRFMGIKMIASTDYAITLFHKDYVVYKQNWMIRKMPLMPGLEAYVKKPDSAYTIVKPFMPGKINNADPSLN